MCVLHLGGLRAKHHFQLMQSVLQLQPAANGQIEWDSTSSFHLRVPPFPVQFFIARLHLNLVTFEPFLVLYLVSPLPE